MNTESKRALEKKAWITHIKRWLVISDQTSQKEYCLKHGLSESAFSKWKNRLFPKRKRPNLKSVKLKFWENEINHWLNTNHSQADYCTLLDESEGTFSKWKNKLHPSLKYNRNRTKQKNKYIKYSKISREKTDILIDCFIHRKPASDAANLAKVSTKTSSRYYRLFKIKLISGATNYPDLFYGAGMLLLLGPLPHIQETLMKVYELNNKEKTQKNLYEYTVETILIIAHLKLSSAEARWFHFMGMQRYYYLIYSKKSSIGSQDINYENFSDMIKNTSISGVMQELWWHYLEHYEEESHVLDGLWTLVFYKREYDTSDDYYKMMRYDFKWALLHSRPGKRKDYWDDYIPSVEEIRDIDRKMEKRFLEAEGSNYNVKDINQYLNRFD